jgi:hypothetical protein
VCDNEGYLFLDMDDYEDVFDDIFYGDNNVLELVADAVFVADVPMAAEQEIGENHVPPVVHAPRNPVW